MPRGRSKRAPLQSGYGAESETGRSKHAPLHFISLCTFLSLLYRLRVRGFSNGSAMFQLACILAIACALSARIPAQKEAAADALKPAAFLAGTWMAQGEFPGAGKYTIRRNYRSLLGGKFMLSSETMQVGSAEVTREMWMGVDPARGTLGAWAFSSDGSVAILRVAQGSGDALVLEGALTGSSDAGLYRSTLQRNGNDRFTQTIETQKNGAWTAYAAFTFERTALLADVFPPSAAPAAALKPLEVMAGNWRAEGESDGSKFAVDYANTWTMGGHFLRSDYSVTTNGKTEFQGAAYFFSDPESKTLRQIGFRADGSVSEMKVACTAGSVLLDGEITTPIRRTPTRITYARPDAGSITITTESQRQDGSWRRSGAATLQRRP